MSSRGAGAGIAVIAAALLAVSVATPVVLPGELALYSGHPTVGGHTRRTQEVYVGLVSAELCNTGGDGRCSPGADQEKFGFRMATYGELGATGLLALSTVALALLTLWNSDRRKGAATLVRFASVLAMVGAVALIVQGPFDEASIPIGLGMPLYAAGILCALVASILAVRAPPPIKLRVADRGSQPAVRVPQPPAPSLPRAQAFEHQASSGDDRRQPRDASRDPRAGRDPGGPAAPPPSGGELAGELDRFAPPDAPAGADRPMFSSGQLRPLYDAAPQQGGTGGLLPVERPPVPTRPPTPIARSAVSALAGIPTPASIHAENEPATTLPPSFGARSKPSSVPPPISPPPISPPSAPPINPSPMPGPPMIAVPAAAGPLHTQVSLVPPMPDNDLPIAPPTAQIMSERPPEGAERPSSMEPNQFRRPETPLAAPPPPVVVPPRPRNDSQPPRPHRESQPPPRPERESQPPRPPVRAAVPMPVRPPRAAPSPTRPPIPAPAPPRNPLPRPTIHGSAVPPPFFSTIPGISGIPPIPAIPPLPPQSQRATTDPDEQITLAAGDLGDLDQATVARAPLEFGDTSQTDVSFGTPASDEREVAAYDAGARRGAPGGIGIDDAIDTAGRPRAAPTGFQEIDTSPTAEPVVPVDDGRRTKHSTDVDGEAVTTAAHGAYLHGEAVTTAARGADHDGEAVTVAARGADLHGEAVTMPARSAGGRRAARPRAAATAPPSPPQVRDRAISKVPLSTAPDSLPPPLDNKQSSGPSPACPQCESPMSWIDEHLRFYCKSCRMYF